MKKFIIKKTYTALKENQTFKKGHQETWYIGKECFGVTALDRELSLDVIEAGWRRKCDAQKVINNEIKFNERTYNTDGFWNIEYEIVEFEVK